MTRIILKLFEKTLQLTNLTKINQRSSSKQNLCAPCFNKISEFQDFLEQCKDSDEFWKSQFEDLKEIPLQKHSTFEETELLPLAEDSNSLEADTTVSTTEVENTMHIPHVDKEQNDFHLMQVIQEETFLMPTSQITEEENETEDLNVIDLATEWPDDTNGDDSEIQINVDSEYDATTKNINDDFIEYEYKIEENEEVEIDEIPNINDSMSSDTCGVDYRSFSYEEIETEEIKKEQTENAFFLTTSLDQNGKVKMAYKCPMCDKSFNRIYDIESHYNIHKGIKPFTCNVCGKSFRQKNILTTHLALHFGKKVECTECDKKFARRSQLILHYRMHRDEKPFVCDIDGCQAAFRQRKQLIDHSFTHSEEKNFQCATCTKSFHTRKRLQDHLYKVHSQHRYRCELCEKGFLKPHMLKHHMIAVHNMEVDDVSHLKTFIDAIKPAKKKVIN